MVKQNPIIYACLICIFLFYSGLVKIKERNPFISLIKPEQVSELTGKIKSSPIKISSGKFYSVQLEVFDVKSIQNYNSSAKGIITAFWILLDFWDDVLFSTVATFPAKIEFITSKDAYDIIVVEKGQENMINIFFNKFQNNTIRHLVVVQDETQMYKLNFPGIEAYCIVNENGDTSYYQEQEG